MPRFSDERTIGKDFNPAPRGLDRAYYSDRIEHFLERASDEILGALSRRSAFVIESTQKQAWLEQIRLLKEVLQSVRRPGKVYFEYSVPRLGKRIDVVLLLGEIIFVLEFKVGETEFRSSAIDQVLDYALDLKNFHETSRDKVIVPILVATRAESTVLDNENSTYADAVNTPLLASASTLESIISNALDKHMGPDIQAEDWESGQYRPTPTIVEAAVALYGGHQVTDISRNDAAAINLTKTSDTISEIIRSARESKRKSICFVTGVPGAGKTLVGLNIATKHMDPKSALHSVYLSGNGPLLAVLGEALARDKVQRAKATGEILKKGKARSEVKAFIQNVHHFRDECLLDVNPPVEHVVLFDEAQRAWNRQQTVSFMARKKGRLDFDQSEPEFLISCMDRHQDWAVIVCLVGGGQEINTGEGGISEWIVAIQRQFAGWHMHISSKLNDTEFGIGNIVDELRGRPDVQFSDSLHLAVSMRSFRAEDVSSLVKHLLDRDEDEARQFVASVLSNYPVAITRDLGRAKSWLRDMSRGSERYGLVASSQAQRLKPHAIDVKSPMDPVHWFLDGKDDVRSSFYLEDVATEFHVQGLELDWSCVVWDADFRYQQNGWQHFSFVGDRWNKIHKQERQTYLKNAYRVLLTRARQGMVIVVPPGDDGDHTRPPEYYNSTYEYLTRLGLQVL